MSNAAIIYTQKCAKVRMSGNQWVHPNLPRRIYEELDRWAQSDEGRKQGYSSGKDVIVVLMRDFLDTHTPPPIESEIEFVGIINDQIVLKDTIFGSKIIEIDKDKKLQCYDCADSPHENRWVDFCLTNREIWPFLRRNGVKVVKLRDKTH